MPQKQLNSNQLTENEQRNVYEKVFKDVFRQVTSTRSNLVTLKKRGKRALKFLRRKQKVLKEMQESFEQAKENCEVIALVTEEVFITKEQYLGDILSLEDSYFLDINEQQAEKNELTTLIFDNFYVDKNQSIEDEEVLKDEWIYFINEQYGIHYEYINIYNVLKHHHIIKKTKKWDSLKLESMMIAAKVKLPKLIEKEQIEITQLEEIIELVDEVKKDLYQMKKNLRSAENSILFGSEIDRQMKRMVKELNEKLVALRDTKVETLFKSIFPEDNFLIELNEEEEKDKKYGDMRRVMELVDESKRKKSKNTINRIKYLFKSDIFTDEIKAQIKSIIKDNTKLQYQENISKLKNSINTLRKNILIKLSASEHMKMFNEYQRILCFEIQKNSKRLNLDESTMRQIDTQIRQMTEQEDIEIFCYDILEALSYLKIYDDDSCLSRLNAYSFKLKSYEIEKPFRWHISMEIVESTLAVLTLNYGKVTLDVITEESIVTLEDKEMIEFMKNNEFLELLKALERVKQMIEYLELKNGKVRYLNISLDTAVEKIKNEIEIEECKEQKNEKKTQSKVISKKELLSKKLEELKDISSDERAIILEKAEKSLQKADECLGFLQRIMNLKYTNYTLQRYIDEISEVKILKRQNELEDITKLLNNLDTEISRQYAREYLTKKGFISNIANNLKYTKEKLIEILNMHVTRLEKKISEIERKKERNAIQIKTNEEEILKLIKKLK